MVLQMSLVPNNQLCSGTAGLPSNTCGGGSRGAAELRRAAAAASDAILHRTAASDEAADAGVWATVSEKQARCLGIERIPSDVSVAPAMLESAKVRKYLGRWKKESVKPGASLADAIDALETANQRERRMLRSQIMFRDGTILRFNRENMRDPTSLHCKECFVPNAPVPMGASLGQKSTGPRPKEKSMSFLCDSSGHLKKRKKKEAWQKNSFTIPPENRTFIPRSTGAHKYMFQPVGYVAHLLRPNVHIGGCRPGIRESSRDFVQFRPRSAAPPAPSASRRSARCASAQGRSCPRPELPVSR